MFVCENKPSLWRAVETKGTVKQPSVRENNIIEVNILVLGDWQRLAQEMPSELPVIFRYDGQKPMETEDYCDGLQVRLSRMWEGHSGWQPCILVTLGESF